MMWLVGLGGSFGAAARFLLGQFIMERFKRISPFPLGTLIINVLGSFILGVLANFHEAGQISDWIWFLGGIGFCGAFTTFSTFGYETVTLLQTKRIKFAIIYISLSVVVSIIFAILGLYFI